MGLRAAALGQRRAGTSVGKAHELGWRERFSHEHRGLSVERPALHPRIEAAQQPMPDVEDIGGLVSHHVERTRFELGVEDGRGAGHRRLRRESVLDDSLLHAVQKRWIPHHRGVGGEDLGVFLASLMG